MDKINAWTHLRAQEWIKSEGGGALKFLDQE